MSKHTAGPWSLSPHREYVRYCGMHGANICDLSVFEGYPDEKAGNARLIAAAPDLLSEANVLRCLATSPRFQQMTVSDALNELRINGCGHDDGAAIAKAEGREP